MSNYKLPVLVTYGFGISINTDAQKRLEDIAAKFRASKVHLDTIAPELVNTYQSAPGQEAPSIDEKSESISKFREVISDFQSECVKLRDYFSSEIAQGNYFQSVPDGAVIQVGNAVNEAFWILCQLITALSPQSTIEIFDLRNRQIISEAIASQRTVCDLVRTHANDEGVRDAFQRIEEICDGIPSSYFAVPVSQPDQIPQGNYEPQEPSGEDNEQTNSPQK